MNNTPTNKEIAEKITALVEMSETGRDYFTKRVTTLLDERDREVRRLIDDTEGMMTRLMQIVAVLEGEWRNAGTWSQFDQETIEEARSIQRKLFDFLSPTPPAQESSTPSTQPTVLNFSQHDSLKTKLEDLCAAEISRSYMERIGASCSLYREDLELGAKKAGWTRVGDAWERNL